jgi:maleate isomerase
MYGYRGKIGILVPNINTTMEMDFHRMAPEGVSVHTARISWEAPESSVEALREMTERAVKAATDVAAAHVDVIVYGCTSGSFFKGITWDKELSKIIARETKVPAITTSTAMVEGLREMGIKKVSVATPYSEEVDKRLEAFLSGNGFKVMRLESLRQKDVWEHARNAPFILYQLGKKTFVPEADGVFISCTQLRAVDIVEQLEKDIGKPVVTAVQASMWLALRTLGFKSPVNGYGTLLTRF